MPLRAYRCALGHEFEVMESMDGPRTTICLATADGDDESSLCGDHRLEPIMQITQRAIIKGGTPTHHKGRGI